MRHIALLLLLASCAPSLEQVAKPVERAQDLSKVTEGVLGQVEAVRAVAHDEIARVNQRVDDLESRPAEQSTIVKVVEDAASASRSRSALRSAESAIESAGTAIAKAEELRADIERGADLAAQALRLAQDVQGRLGTRPDIDVDQIAGQAALTQTTALGGGLAGILGLLLAIVSLIRRKTA